MKPLAREELLDLDAYEEARAAYRDAVIELKARRRLAVGDRVSLVFENRETLRFQVQEMLRIERIHDPESVQRELDVYNELVPGEGELSATLFVEITESSRIRHELDRLVGIDEHVSLVLGDGADAEELPARFDPKQLEEDRISAVQYLKFRVPRRWLPRLADPALPARVRIDHPNYRCEAELPGLMRESLLGDLTGEPAPLLDARGFEQRPAPGEVVLRETAGLRVVRPARPLAPGHLIVEARRRDVSLLSAPKELRDEMIEEVQRLARELSDERGGCRITLQAEAAPLRWHLLPRS
ncbi:MAG TPA: DUF3501 family protein [Myxococcota bacterium]|nr:DUF3501 family protein [Myxococcota bacterium]